MGLIFKLLKKNNAGTQLDKLLIALRQSRPRRYLRRLRGSICPLKGCVMKGKRYLIQFWKSCSHLLCHCGFWDSRHVISALFLHLRDGIDNTKLVCITEGIAGSQRSLLQSGPCSPWHVWLTGADWPEVYLRKGLRSLKGERQMCGRVEFGLNRNFNSARASQSWHDWNLGLDCLMWWLSCAL